jgi:hypothetical protein
MKITTGKRRRSMKFTVRKLNKQMEKAIWRFQRIRPFDNHGTLACGQNTFNNKVHYPLYVFDLTCINNYGQSVVHLPKVGLRFAQTGAFDNVTEPVWETVIGDAPNGQLGNQGWHAEKMPTSSAIENQAAGASFLRWIDLRLNCWGCQSRPTKFTIQIIKIKEEDYDPWKFVNANINTDLSTFQARQKHMSFWSSQVKSYAYNPIASIGTSDLQKGFKVVKNVSFTIDPTMSTESDPDPHVKTIKWFMKLNKYLNYKTHQENNSAINYESVYSNQYISDSGQSNNCYVGTRYKTILVVKALAVSPTNFEVSDTIDSARTPSFDILLRSCHEKFV